MLTDRLGAGLWLHGCRAQVLQFFKAGETAQQIDYLLYKPPGVAACMWNFSDRGLRQAGRSGAL